MRDNSVAEFGLWMLLDKDLLTFGLLQHIHI